MRKFCIYCFLLIGLLPIFALNVNEQELKNTDNKKVEFINYTGTHDSVDTADAIMGIGRNLGAAVLKKGTAGNPAKYYIIHAADSTEKKGFDADILVLGKDAAVDHIRNLRLIISAYLSSAYGYSAKDAKTIAHFITVYNAVYRNRISMFQEKYKPVVLKYLEGDKVGISLKYSEWAGQTQIIIPLSDEKYAGTLSSVDTGTISDKEVIGKMREEDGKDIEARKDMVDLKERESAEAQQRSEEASKEAENKQKEANEAKNEAAQLKQEADKKEKAAEDKEKAADKKQSEADEAKKKADESGDLSDKKAAEDKQKEADKAKKEADAAKKEADDAASFAEQKEAEAEQKEAEAEQKRQEAEIEQQMAEEKEDDAQSDRKDIAADTQKIIEDKKAEKKAEADSVIEAAFPGYALRVTDEINLYSELILFDLRTARKLRTSAVDIIHGRSLYDVDNNLLAIAGSSSGNGVISLVLINPKSLEIVKQGDVNISPKSVLVQHGEDYYAVIDGGGMYYIGRFNSLLEEKARSSIQVLPYTPITVTEKGLLVQDINNGIKLISISDLKEVVIE